MQASPDTWHFVLKNPPLRNRARKSEKAQNTISCVWKKTTNATCWSKRIFAPTCCFFIFGEKMRILNKSAEQFLDGNNDVFDIIFLDPPYNKGIIRPIIEKIIKTDALAEEGIIVLESDNTDEHDEFSGLEILKQRKYGRTYITVYKRG